MDTNRRFISLVASTLTASVVIMLAGLATGSLTAKLLGVAGRGELAAIQLVGGFLGGFCIAGLPSAVVYFTGVNSRSAEGYFVTGLVLAMILAVPCSILGYWAIPHLLATNSSKVQEAARIYLAFIPLTVLSAFVLAAFQGEMQIRIWNILRTFATVLWLGPVLYMYIVGDFDSGQYANIYLIYLALYVLIFLGIYRFLRQITSRLDFSQAKPLISYGWTTTIATYSQQSNLKLDQMIIAAYLMPEQLGTYVVAVAWSAAHSPLVNAATQVIVPYVSRMSSIADQSIALSKIIRVSLLLNLLLSAALILITPFAIDVLFGAQYINSVPVAYVLIFGSMFSNIKSVIVEAFKGLGRPQQVMRGEVYGIIITVLLFGLSLQDPKLVNIATALVLGSVFTFLYFSVRLKAYLNTSLTKLLIPTKEDITYVTSNVRDLIRRRSLRTP